MNREETYELVVGLEVHAQLTTRSKLFSSDSAETSGEPNTQVSLITLAHPGTLPRLNREAVLLAIRMGLACHCTLEEENFFARKHYFYPDLPKGYQTTQHTRPVCKGGYVRIRTRDGVKDIALNRIHMEEDAGKSLHDQHEAYTCIDYNRAGTPLLEIVTEPAIHSAEDASAFLTELRKLLRWTGVCDGNMEEGSMRCDANISVRPKGASTLGTKVEVKNLNSIRHVRKAIEYEAARLTGILAGGGTIRQETRSFDAATDSTFAIRDKEEANDYRYFPDPDLPPFRITPALIEQVAATLPALPETVYQRLVQHYGLNEYDAAQLTADQETAFFYLQAADHTGSYKSLANWLNGPLKEWCNEHKTTLAALPLGHETLAAVIKMTESGKISFSAASGKLLPALLANPGATAESLAEELNLVQTSDNGQIEAWVSEAIERMPDKADAYRKGKKGLLGLFVAEVKKISKGQADPKAVTKTLEEKLKSYS